MTIEGVDYSWDRPDPHALIDAGKYFACRYLSDEPSKNLTRAEADAGADAGLWWVVVWEASDGQELPDVAWSAAESVAQAQALGVPAGRPIYFAVDWDAQADEFDAIEAFLRDYGSRLGPYVAGVYGGERVVGAMLDRGAVRWAWQTYAWSNNLDPRAQLWQYSNNVTVVGANVDLDRAYASDYGQWQPGRLPSMSVEDDFRRVVEIIRGWGFDVREEGGCYGRSNGSGWSAGRPVGHINHHYVCSLNSSQSYIDGLVGNLVGGDVVNWFADVNGRAYLIGTGPMNHAGTGNSSVLNLTKSDQPPPSFPAQNSGDIGGNSHYAGTECQHPGDSTPWPGPMLDVMVAINAAEAIVFGWTAQRAINHAEWTSRKIDMSAGGGVNSDGWAGDELRRRVDARMSGTAPGPGPGPEPTPEPEDDMPRSIITIYDGNMNPLGQALDGPTGVVSLANPDESNAVAAVIDTDKMANPAQVDIYNAVLARSPVLIGIAHKVWDDHFEATPGGGSASTGDILAAVYQTTVDLRDA